MAVHWTGAASARQRLIHDPLDGPSAPPALGAAAQAAVHLARGARGLGSGHGVAHIAIAEDVTGTDNHGSGVGAERLLIPLLRFLADVLTWRKRKSASLRDSKLRTYKGNPVSAPGAGAAPEP